MQVYIVSNGFHDIVRICKLGGEDIPCRSLEVRYHVGRNPTVRFVLSGAADGTAWTEAELVAPPSGVDLPGRPRGSAGTGTAVVGEVPASYPLTGIPPRPLEVPQ